MTGWIIAVAAAAGLGGWYAVTRRAEVRCTVDLEATHDHFHAHVDLDGVEVNEGDAVLVHNTPARIPFGTVRTFESTATVYRASWIKRQLVRLFGSSEISALYEVGFEG
jgi:hypothetical protein